MNTGICDCGRLRQISFQVATAVLEPRSSTVSLHLKTDLRRLPEAKRGMMLSVCIRGL